MNSAMPYNIGYAQEWEEEGERIDREMWEVTRAYELNLAEALQKEEKKDFTSVLQKKGTEGEKEKKPVLLNKRVAEGLPFYALVYLALLNADGEEIGVKDIYAFIQNIFTNYRNLENDSWKGAVRHQLVEYRTCVIQMKNGSFTTYVLKEETKLHLKFARFCENNPDTSSFCLDEDYSWEDVKKGHVGIPDGEPRNRNARVEESEQGEDFFDGEMRNEGSRKRKARDEDDDAYGLALFGIYKKPFTCQEDLWNYHN